MWHYRFVTYEDENSSNILLGVVRAIQASDEGEKLRFVRSDPINPFDLEFNLLLGKPEVGEYASMCCENELRYLKKSFKKHGVVPLSELDRELNIATDGKGYYQCA